WIKRIPCYIKKLIELKGGNNYREGAEEKQAGFPFSYRPSYRSIIDMDLIDIDYKYCPYFLTARKFLSFYLSFTLLYRI
ncbi:uncharacterized protein K441DRAFT_559391, partial [Cenococcum geophilum 1.58]|uniref:uncharacterized protein n=1 Tax=Cenococcum geophilum 1.58 TaxID=794803 RepID=UPI00358F1E01